MSPLVIARTLGVVAFVVIATIGVRATDGIGGRLIAVVFAVIAAALIAEHALRMMRSDT